MSVTPLNWRAAGAVAEQLLAGWQRRGEPGGAITLFDAEQLRATACAGLADLAQNTPFTADSVVRFASPHSPNAGGRRRQCRGASRPGPSECRGRSPRTS